MLFQIPDSAWLNFPSPPEAGQGHSRKTREQAGGNSCQGTMSVLIPQECTSEIYITVMTTTDTQQDNPAGQTHRGCYCCCCCLFWFVSEKLADISAHCVCFYAFSHCKSCFCCCLFTVNLLRNHHSMCVASKPPDYNYVDIRRNIKTKWKWYQSYHLISLKTANMKFSMR